MSQSPNSQLPSPSSTRSSDENEVLVRVEGVSKKFCRDLKKSLWYGVCDIASELNPFRSDVAEDRRLKIEDRAAHEIVDSRSDKGAQTSNFQLPTSASKAGSPTSISQLLSSSPNEALDSELRPDEFYAVRDVSFELRRGECLGLIGRNGAGKTTLLKMLNGLIKPDSGRIEMRGRIGALIALGAGFNPILTGRENVYVNGTVLGLTKKEIDAKFDEIVDFAEVEEFIDTPVRSYSSGMQVRLGFAVASTLDPDVLIIDEVLAVGDAGFRSKCYERVNLLKRNAAIIFVSHNMVQISRLCSRSLLLDRGHVIVDDHSSVCISKYNSLNVNKGNTQGRFGNGSMRVKCFSIIQNNYVTSNLIYSRPLSIELCIENKTADARRFVIDIAFKSITGDPIAECSNFLKDSFFDLEKGTTLFKVKCFIQSLQLNPGTYQLCFYITDHEMGIHYDWWEVATYIEVIGNKLGVCDVQFEGDWQLCLEK